jgi:hypothetical protein
MAPVKKEVVMAMTLNYLSRRKQYLRKIKKIVAITISRLNKRMKVLTNICINLHTSIGEMVNIMTQIPRIRRSRRLQEMLVGGILCGIHTTTRDLCKRFECHGTHLTIYCILFMVDF